MRKARRLPAQRALLWTACGLAVALASGCVERVVKIQTNPAGALVIVNDEEVGVTPTEFAFIWYGDYDIVIRKRGYETLKTHYRINPPWYQFPPFDLIAENFHTGRIRDEHVLPTFALQPQSAPTIDETVRNATEMRDQALYQNQ